MSLVHFPKLGEETLVRDHALPDGLDEHARGKMLGVVFAQHVFPRVEFEALVDRDVVFVGIPSIGIDPDLADVYHLGRVSGLGSAVHEVGHGAQIFLVFGPAGEVEDSVLRIEAERLDEALLQEIVLVGSFGKPAGLDLVDHPVMLEVGGLENRGRGICVVFEHLGRTGAVIGKIEATIEVSIAVVPAGAHQIDHAVGDCQTFHALV